jgi:hypothetical protein
MGHEIKLVAPMYIHILKIQKGYGSYFKMVETKTKGSLFATGGKLEKGIRARGVTGSGIRQNEDNVRVLYRLPTWFKTTEMCWTKVNRMTDRYTEDGESVAEKEEG